MHSRALTSLFARRQLVMEVMSKLEGAYGLLVKSAHYVGELVACKRGSPLIMGIREPGAQRPRLAGTGPACAPSCVRPYRSQCIVSRHLKSRHCMEV